MNMKWITIMGHETIFRRQSPRLERVNADIARLERIGLVGLSGAGKSTLANLIFGTRHPDGGKLTYHVDGLRIIGYLRQSSSYAVHTFSGFGLP